MRDGWVAGNLGDLVRVTSGFAFSTKSWRQHGIPVIKINNVRNGQVSIENCSFIQEPVPEGASRFLLKKGDLLITLTGEIGAIGFVTQSEPMYLNQRVGRLDLLVRERVSLKFIGLFLSLPEVRAEMWSHGKGNAQLNISPTSIQSLTINLPPLPEQNRIVDLISSVDSYIEALQEQVESAKKSRNAVLHELLTAGGNDWKYKTLSDICEVRDGTHDSPKPSNVGFALVTSKNIKDGRLDLESAYLISPEDYIEVNKRSKVEQFNLLISMIGTIGEVIVVEKEPDFAIKNVGLLKSTDPILSRYLRLYLGSQLGQNALSLSVSGSTQKFISLGKLRALPVLFPPRENQKAIVESMSLFDEQISKNLKVSEGIKSLRSSLLSDLLSGEHEIPASYDKIIGAA